MKVSQMYNITDIFYTENKLLVTMIERLSLIVFDEESLPP